ncbi:hypothetical protein NEIELOOT_01813, partial [Neisseria elongata subsp. glycolytica ATCC 29315]
FQRLYMFAGATCYKISFASSKAIYLVWALVMLVLVALCCERYFQLKLLQVITWDFFLRFLL